ncbi:MULTISPECIES: hypothetical protein [Bacillus cereus group]|nr:hypothetical protein [Bacillus mycoides]
MKKYENQNLYFKSQLKVIAIIILDSNLKNIKKREELTNVLLFFMCN